MDNLTAKPPQLLAIAFVQDARAYVESARTLARIHHEHTEILPAHLFPTRSGNRVGVEGSFVGFWVSKKTLRDRIRHNITLAFRYARRFFSFIPTDERFAELAVWLAPHHSDRSFRYRKTGSRLLPVASEAAEIILNTVEGG